MELARGSATDAPAVIDWRGTPDAVVATTQEHGRDLHNMEASEQDDLAMARPATD